MTKVKEVLEDNETIESIMAKYDKKNETKEEYNINRKKRILELLAIAEVSEEQYVQALSYSKAAYSVHLKRDLDEIYINSFNCTSKLLKVFVDFSEVFSRSICKKVTYSFSIVP